MVFPPKGNIAIEEPGAADVLPTASAMSRCDLFR